MSAQDCPDHAGVSGQRVKDLAGGGLHRVDVVPVVGAVERSQRLDDRLHVHGCYSPLGLGGGLPQPAHRHDVLVGGARASAHDDLLGRAAAQAGRMPCSRRRRCVASGLVNRSNSLSPWLSTTWPSVHPGEVQAGVEQVGADVGRVRRGRSRCGPGSGRCTPGSPRRRTAPSGRAGRRSAGTRRGSCSAGRRVPRMSQKSTHSGGVMASSGIAVAGPDGGEDVVLDQ